MINHKEDENYKKKSHIDTTLINLGRPRHRVQTY